MFGNEDTPTDIEALFDAVAPVIEAIIPDIADLLVPHLLRRARATFVPGYVPRSPSHALLEVYPMERALMPFLSHDADIGTLLEDIETLHRFENGNYIVAELPEDEDSLPEEIMFSPEDFLVYLMYGVACRILDAWLYEIALTLYETNLFGADKVPPELFDEAMLPPNPELFVGAIDEHDLDLDTAIAVLKEVKALLPPGSALPEDVIEAFKMRQQVPVQEEDEEDDSDDDDDDSGSAPPYSLN